MIPYLPVLLFLLLLSGISSCKHAEEQEDPGNIITAWQGRTIRFPDSTLCSEMGEVRPCRTTAPRKYNVLVYTDSVGCANCKLRLDEWKRFMKELDAEAARNVDFQFYFNPKRTNNLTELFKREYFRIPVHIDVEDELNRLNQFPKDMEYQCFLLDAQHKVLLVGNPTLNPKVWELYKNTISGQVPLAVNE